MDLGLKGKGAIVCAASKGLGHAGLVTGQDLLIDGGAFPGIL